MTQYQIGDRVRVQLEPFPPQRPTSQEIIGVIQHIKLRGLIEYLLGWTAAEKDAIAQHHFGWNITDKYQMGNAKPLSGYVWFGWVYESKLRGKVDELATVHSVNSVPPNNYTCPCGNPKLNTSNDKVCWRCGVPVVGYTGV